MDRKLLTKLMQLMVLSFSLALPVYAEEVPAVPATPPVDSQLTGTSAAAPRRTALEAIEAQEQGVLLKFTGPVSDYKSFTLAKPNRLIIDVNGVVSGLKEKSVTVNRFGISTARIGVAADKLRIVLDVSSKLPAYEVKPVEGGLSVIFADSAAAAQPAAAPAAAAPQEAPVAAAAPAKVAPAKSAPGQVTAIDFKREESASRLLVSYEGGCVVQEPVKGKLEIVITLSRCQLPKKLQRGIETASVSTNIKRVVPFQVKAKGGKTDTKIVVKLAKADAAYSLQQDASGVIVTFSDDMARKVEDVMPAKVRELADSTAPAPAAKTGYNQSLPVSDAGTDAAPASNGKYVGRRISLEFADADIRKIFQLLSEVSGLNFLIGDDVSGNVSIKLSNVPWDQALDKLVEIKNLAMVREGNIIHIKTKDKETVDALKAQEKARELKTEIIQINYSVTADVAKQLEKLKSKDGTVVIESIKNEVKDSSGNELKLPEFANRIIVTDYAYRIDMMKALMAQIDRPEKQVLIEARIVEATSDFTRDLGIQWGIHYPSQGTGDFLGMNSFNTAFGGVLTGLAPTTGTTGPGAFAGMQFGTLGSNVKIDLRLSAAETLNKVKIVSSPKVLTLNNRPAKITQGDEIPYVTQSTADGPKIEFRKAALQLIVVPHITPDGVNLSVIVTKDLANTNIINPPISKKEVVTELHLKNGETSVIGGIYIDTDTEQDTGVPYLKNIPGIGWLFKSSSKRNEKKELLILLTPKVVT